jgi:phage gpG-like protein
MSTVITTNGSALTALFETLRQRNDNMQSFLAAVGNDIMERTKQRFSTGTAPDGTPWTANTQATLANYIYRRSGHYASFSNVVSHQKGLARVENKKGYFKKDGSLSKKSQTLLENKRPLHGEGGSLAQQFHVSTDADSVTVGSSMKYAAMQQYGGKKSAFPNLWGDIPARPFLPVMPDGSLYPQEERLIIDALRDYLSV